MKYMQREAGIASREPIYDGDAITSSAIKQALKQTYPDIRFSVTSKRRCPGRYLFITVAWQAGPNGATVQRYVQSLPINPEGKPVYPEFVNR